MQFTVRNISNLSTVRLTYCDSCRRSVQHAYVAQRHRRTMRLLDLTDSGELSSHVMREAKP